MAPCPKCRGLVQERVVVGPDGGSHQRYCLNCGWVKYASIETAYTPVRTPRQGTRRS